MGGAAGGGDVARGGEVAGRGDVAGEMNDSPQSAQNAANG